jgi:hypothetical protein
MRKTNNKNFNLLIKMENIFVIAAVISVTYIIGKFIEMRFIEKENKPLKLLIRDALVVYLSVIFGDFIIKQVNPVIHSVSGGAKVTPVFTDNPGF